MEFTRRLNVRLPKPVTYQAVRKWAAAGRLPRTEWTGETRYAEAIEAMLGGGFTKDALMNRAPYESSAEVVEAGPDPDPEPETAVRGDQRAATGCHFS